MSVRYLTGEGAENCPGKPVKIKPKSRIRVPPFREHLELEHIEREQPERESAEHAGHQHLHRKMEHGKCNKNPTGKAGGIMGPG